MWLGADAVAGPALDDGSWRLGAGLSAALESTLRPLGVGGSVRYVMRPRDQNVTLDWLSFAAGISARPRLTSILGGELAIAGVVERLHATADAGSRTESGSRWLLGARGRLGAMVPARTWALTLGSELEWRAGATTIRVSNRRIGDARELTYVVTLGVQFLVL